jgi:hypothetical protein
MMVFVVLAGYYYDRSTILGVFESSEKADNFILNAKTELDFEYYETHMKELK